jgi:hypothetical protein
MGAERQKPVPLANIVVSNIDFNFHLLIAIIQPTVWLDAILNPVLYKSLCMCLNKIDNAATSMRQSLMHHSNRFIPIHRRDDY